MTMPPLPRALCRDDTVHDADYFTADQMHAYARAYAAQRVAPLVEALRASATALDLALPIVQLDAQMMADITRHAPLDPAQQAKHDATEYASERLSRDIPALIRSIQVAIAAQEKQHG